MKNLSHPIKTAEVQILAMPNVSSQVHKAGCAHSRKADHAFAAQTTEAFLAFIGADDYFDVAPCARKA